MAFAFKSKSSSPSTPATPATPSRSTAYTNSGQRVTISIPASKLQTSRSSIDSSYANSGQAILESGGYTGFAATPYTPRAIDMCDRSLHHTNRSQYEAQFDHETRWFVTTHPHFRECLTEFLGTFVMVVFGMGVNNQVVLSEGKNGTWLSINMAWGIAVLMGVYVSEGVSGAHMNCAVTFAHAVYGRLPWWKVPGYWASQVVGAFVGACAAYVLHYERLKRADPSQETTFHNFATHPEDISNLTAFYTEVLATAMLLLCIYAITDQRNRSPGTVGTPFAFCLMIMALGMSFGMNSGYAMNPARDFGPRFLMFLVGYGSKVFTEYDCYFLIPIFGPLVGGVIGAGMYTFLVQVQHPHEPEGF
jgi:aquaporin-7